MRGERGALRESPLKPRARPIGRVPQLAGPVRVPTISRCCAAPRLTGLLGGAALDGIGYRGCRIVRVLDAHVAVAAPPCCAPLRGRPGGFLRARRPRPGAALAAAVLLRCARQRRWAVVVGRADAAIVSSVAADRLVSVPARGASGEGVEAATLHGARCHHIDVRAHPGLRRGGAIVVGTRASAPRPSRYVATTRGRNHPLQQHTAQHTRPPPPPELLPTRASRTAVRSRACRAAQAHRPP